MLLGGRTASTGLVVSPGVLRVERAAGGWLGAAVPVDSLREKLGGTSIEIDGMTSSPSAASPVSNETRAARSLDDPSTRDGSGSRPVSSLRAGSVTIDPPAELSKRVTRLNWRVGPPTSSHGIQMLYESPKLVLL